MILAITFILIPSLSSAKGKSPSAFGNTVRVKTFQKKDGTYVPAHFRTAPDRLKHNNWSTKGNVNPYTSKPGTREL